MVGIVRQETAKNHDFTLLAEIIRALDQLIEAAKRDVYTPRHGETRPTASPKRKEEENGAR